MNYMVYVTHDAENLQFYLWLADYYQRFQRATKAEKRLYVLLTLIRFPYFIGINMIPPNNNSQLSIDWDNPW